MVKELVIFVHTYTRCDQKINVICKFHELRMFDSIVPKLLNFEQKQRRMDAQKMLRMFNDDPVLHKKVISV